MTLQQVGNRLGVSDARVRQLECRALEKLRDALVRECDAARTDGSYVELTD